MTDAGQAAAPVRCHSCAASCCRLTVVLVAGDNVPAEMTARRGESTQMVRGDDGLCVAVDRERMSCSIYATRPAACRRFAMDGPYCRAIRELRAPPVISAALSGKL